jgi:site-specific recombinase XerD
LSAYLDDKRSQGHSSSAIFQATIALRHFYRFLAAQNLIKEDPMTGIRLPKLVSAPASRL